MAGPLDWQALDDLAANRIGLPLSLEKSEALFGDAGINQDTHVVAYDGSGGLYAARGKGLLERFGRTDGNYQKRILRLNLLSGLGQCFNPRQL